ncbi:MlaD family protein [Amycolatopsis thermoflava]|uniref:MlaD family protein n=1 Tax=Amycolatopsis thermoflava TaxID=84480 RepID=UPI0037F19B49
MKRRIPGIVALCAVVIAGAVLLSGSTTDYEVQLVMPSAAQLEEDSPVWIAGSTVGSVRKLEVKDGKALITVAIENGDYAPLHDGTTSRVEWDSVVGERMLTLVPGDEGNAPIPEGGLIEAQSRQVEVDEILGTLDEPTRDHLTSLLRGLDDTVEGRDDELTATLHSLGDSVGALNEILTAVGKDGPAIRDLVTRLHEMTQVAAGKQGELQAIVRDLTTTTGAVSAQQQQLTDSLRELPGTLQTAKGTLDRVPAASDAAVPLLKDLRPATGRLPSIAQNLQPVLTDLRPMVAELRPLLGSARELLEATPGLLDLTHDVVPPVTRILTDYQPIVSFLRPYTPEGIGMLHNWGQSFAPYDGQGHVWAGLLAPGTNLVNESLVQPPGSRRNPEPLPGQPVRQPWTDAAGSGMR